MTFFKYIENFFLNLVIKKYKMSFFLSYIKYIVLKILKEMIVLKSLTFMNFILKKCKYFYGKK